MTKKAPVSCPQCGESDIDKLHWVSPKTVRCQTCERRYLPYRKV